MPASPYKLERGHVTRLGAFMACVTIVPRPEWCYATKTNVVLACEPPNARLLGTTGQTDDSAWWVDHEWTCRWHDIHPSPHRLVAWSAA